MLSDERALLQRRRRRGDALDRARCNALTRPAALLGVDGSPTLETCMAAATAESLLLIGDFCGMLRCVDLRQFELDRLCASTALAVGSGAVSAIRVQSGRVMTCTLSSIVKFWSLQELALSSIAAAECTFDVGAILIDGALSPFAGASDAAAIDMTRQLTLFDTRTAYLRERVRLDTATPLSAVRWLDEHCLLVASQDSSLSIFDARQFAREVIRVAPVPLSSYAWGSSWSAQLMPPEPALQEDQSPCAPLISWTACGAVNVQRLFDPVQRRYRRAFAPHAFSEQPQVRIAVNADASLVATTRRFDTAVKLWALNATGRAVGEGVASCNVASDLQSVDSVAFSPDGRHLVGGCSFSSLALWRAGACGEVQRAPLAVVECARPVLGVVFCGAAAIATLSADGVRVRIGSLD